MRHGNERDPADASLLIYEVACMRARLGEVWYQNCYFAGAETS